MILNVCPGAELVDQTQKQTQLTLPAGMERAEIEHLPNATGHEWVALLLEADEIKKNRPEFNRSLNRVRFRYLLILKNNKEGRFEIGITSHVEPDSNPACLYKSRRVSEKARDALYRQAFGVTPGRVGWSSLVRNLGVKDFNQRIQKVFNEKEYPQKDMTLAWPTGLAQQEILVEIREGRLEDVCWLQEGEVVQKLGIKEDPDIKRLMLSLLKRS